MKRIGIDARLINQTGVGVYIRNLLRNLNTDDPEVEYYVYLFPKDYSLIKNEKLIKRSAPFRWHSAHEQTSFLRVLQKDTLNLMHFTYFSFPYFYNRPFVITIHDLTPLFFSSGKASTLPPPLFHLKHIGYKALLERGVHTAKRILVPSEKVKNDIENVFRKSVGNKIVVTYEGIDEELKTVKPDIRVLDRIKKPFFLYIGNSYPHKNVEKLLQAFSKTPQEHSLVLVGPKDFFASKISTLIKDLHMENRVVQLFDISQAQKVALYKNAHALVQPSLSEGFGLPIIEARYFNCPVLASDIPVFDEILPESTPRFDPNAVASIEQALHDAVHSRLVSAPLDERTFSFKNMAKKTQAVYFDVI